MNVLWIAEDEREGTQGLAEVSESKGGNLTSAPSQVQELHFETAVHDVIGKTQLTIELQDARLHRDRPRSLPGPAVLFDDAKFHAELIQT